MALGDVLHVPQPVVDEAERLFAERGADAAAAVVAEHDDVLDVQHVAPRTAAPTGN